MNYYGVSAFFNGLLGLFLVYYVFLRNKRNPLNRSFLYFGISVSGWSLLYSLWAWAPSQEKAELYTRLHMTFCVFIPATYLHFISHFTQSFGKIKKLIWSIYGICAVAAVLCHTDLMVAGTKRALFFEFWPKPGLLTLYYVIFASAIVAVAFALLIKRAIATAGAQRRQVLLVLFAFAIGYGGGWVNWFLWFDIPVLPTTNFFVGLTFAILAYAIVRHGLMDIDVLVELVRNNRLSKMGLLTASLQHEIKSPLYVMRGLADSYLERLKEGAFESKDEAIERSRQFAEKVAYQSGRASGIIQNFSGFLNNNGRKTEEKKKSSITHVASGLFSLLSCRFNLEGLSCEIDVKEEADEVAVPQGDLEEILLNLITNACESVQERAGLDTGEGYKPSIIVAGKKKGGETFLTVTDNGVGVEAKELYSLFQPLKTTKAHGTGLGLYITQQLCEKNGGRISVASLPGGGLSFTVILPVAIRVSAVEEALGVR